MKSHASMNRIYRLVWNVALNLWVAVAENAKGRSKGGRAGSSRSSVEFSSAVSESAGGSGGFLLSAGCRAALMMFSALGYLGLFAPVVQAEPSGGVVSAGSGSIGQSGAATTINQASQRLAIDWNRFSTAAHESVVFVQPNAQAIALNRVIGSTPSTLLGSLTANGQVFVLNPNGVLFGAGSQVNVGGLVASTLNMSNADFMAGNHVFTNSGGTGSVMNQGTLTAAQGGYIALLAPDVRNEGVISATLGTALLAAGDKVTLNLNNGSLLGFSIDEGALNALADNKHLIQADGGQVLMSARAANALAAATVNNTGVIEAKTLLNQNGVIKLIGDMQFGQANVAGGLDASAPNGGDAGFIETSAARVQVADGTVVSTLAAAGTGGKSGRWLIDPSDFTVAASGGNISGATVSANLGSNSDVLVQSTSGNVIVNDQISWSQNKLTLSALGSIFLNKNLNGSGSASLALEYGQCASECVLGATYNIGAGVKINLPAGLNFTTQSGTAAIKSYTVVTSLGVVNDIGNSSLQGIKNNLSGLYVLGADIDAAATSSPAWLASGGFNPIGSSAGAFTGDLDGLGHTISNLTINRPTTDDVGLFGAKSGTSTLQNLTLTGVNVKGRDRTGALVGHDNSYLSTGKLVNVHSYGSVMGAADTGGLVGLLQAGSVKFSDANGEVTGTGSNTGGLIGRTNYNTSLVFDHFFGNVSGTNVVGGLVGYNTAAIGSSFTNGSTVTGSDSVGGLAGYNSGTIAGSSSSLAVMGTSAVGGLVGYNGGAGTGTIQGNSNATGEVTGTESVGGLVGFQSGSGVTTSSQASGNVHGVGSSANVGGLVGQNEGQVSYSEATGTVNGVDNVGGLVGGNLGTGRVLGSSTSANVSGTNSVGGLVGFQAVNASVDSVSASGTVTGAVAGTNTGGLMGYNAGSIDGGFATGSVLGGSNTGGLLGKNAGTGSISESYALGATGGIAAIGGLVGLNQGDVSTSYALGNVNGQNKVGGLVGENQGSIHDAYSNGNVMGPTNGGGLVGENTLGASIHKSYASGNVSGTTAVGGLVGKNAGVVADTYATGDVTGNQEVGGVVGNHVGTGTLAGSYATGLVSGVESATTYGVIGTGTGTVTGSYWDKETTGQLLSGTVGTGAYGLTTSEMMDSSYLGGLGFSQGCSPKWWLSEGNTRPFLRIEYSRNIRNAHQLQLIAMDPGASYTLANNIDLTELSRPAGMWNINKGFVPLGDSDTPFTGELYGQGYTIDGLKINRPAMTDVGLFGVTGEDNYITSLILTNVDVIGGENTGALVGRATAGYTYNNIEQVQVYGTVVGGPSTGGLVGSSEGADIHSSSFSGSVTGSDNTGGLVGNNSGAIEQSSASGTVSGIVKNGYDGDKVGGLVGYNSGFISHSSASNTVTGQSSAGGLVGYNDSLGGYSNRSSGVNIENSNSSSNVSGSYSVGGLVGYLASGSGAIDVFATGTVTSTGDNAGGLVGYNFGAVERSYATGNVNGGGEYTGGLVGNNDPVGSITKSSATGQVTGTEAVGGLVGHNYGLVSESHASGQVTGSTSVGGLAGENGGNITLSYATGNVNGIAVGLNDPYAVGGLVGSNTYGASIETSYATGSVDSGPDGLKTGGLVGYNAGSIENSYASGSVVGGQYNGGLVGYNTGSISFAYATGSAAGSENTGGLAGYNETYATIDNVYATGFVDGGTNALGFTAGLVGENQGDVSSAYWDKTTTGQVNSGTFEGAGTTGLTSAQFMNSGNLAGLGFSAGSNSSTSWWMSEGNTRPFLRSEYKNTISNAHELQLMAMNTGSGYVVANTINLAEINSTSGMWNPAKGFVPLGDNTNPFTGTFDGGGYTISNLAINRPLENGVGLFGVQSGNVSRIENVLLTDALVVGGLGTGALVGRSTGGGIISNVQSSYGNVFGAGDTGGLVGLADAALIIYAYSDGNVTGSAANTGGLVGATTAGTTIGTAGFFGGTVTGLVNTGGLVGQSAGAIDGTFAYGTVVGTAKTGGLVGENNSSIIHSFSSSIVSGLSSVGGLAGLNNGDISSSHTSLGTVTATERAAGGLVGTNSGTLETAYATGGVYGDVATGGLVGENLGSGTIANAYSTGVVTATGSGSGGLVGINGGSIDTSYSVGQVLSAGANTGGLVGQNTGGVTSSYWNVTTSGQVGSAGGTGKTSAQLLTLSAFSGFDIDDAGATGKTWRIYEGNTNPLLREFLVRISVDNKSVVYNGTSQQGFDPGSTLRTLIVASGRNAGNYSAYSDQQGYDISGGKLAIAKADLALTSSDVNKTYNGGLDASGTAVATGGTQVFAGDALSGGTFAYVNKNAGPNKTVTISGVTVDDSNGGGNYNVTYLDNLTSSISAADLVLTTSNVVKTYDGGLDAVGTAIATGGTQVFAGDVLGGGTFAFTDKNAGSGNRTVTTSGVTISDGNSGGNYNVSYVDNTTSTITPKALTVTGSTAANKVYDGGTAAVVSGGVLSGVISADLAAVSLSQSGNFADKNVANGIAVTAASTLSGAAAGNYSVGQTTGLSANITPKALSVTGSTAANKVYDGGTAAVVSGGVLSGVISADLAAVSLSQSGNFADKNVANGIAVTAASTLSGAAAGNYSVGQTTGLSANITPKALSVTGSTAANKVYDGGTAAVVSGGVLSGVISADLAAVSLNQSGNFADKNVANGIAVTAASTLSGAAAGNYSVGQTTGLSANITPKALSVTGSTAANKVYDGGTAAVVSGGVLSGVISADLAAVSLSQSGNFADKNVANGIAVTAASTLSGTAAGNYSVGQSTGLSANITPKALSVTGSTAANKVYDGGTAAVVSGGVLSGVISADLAAVSLSQSGNFADKNVANGIAVTAASTLSGAAAGNYSVGQTTGLSANITPKALSVTGSTAANKVYDGGTAAVVSGGVLSGVISADLAAVSLNQSGNFADKNVANGIAVTAASTLSGAAAGNYSVGQTTGLSANITPKALSVTGSTAANKVYDGGTAAVVSGGVLSGVISADLAAVSLNQSGNFADKNVANGIAVTAASTLSGAAAGNYSVGQTTGLSANITPKALSVTGSTAANKVYDGGTAAVVSGGVLSGVISADLAAVSLNQSGNFADKNVANGIAVTAASTLSGAAAGNYSVGQTTGLSANITPKALSVTGSTAANKVYDGGTAAVVSGGVLSGVISADLAAVSLNQSGNFADKNVANGIAVTAASTLSGAAAGNYSVGQTTGLSANITPKALSVTGSTAANKVYDGGTAAVVSGGVLSGVISADLAAVSLNQSGNFADKNVANGIAVTAASTLSGAAAGNYSVGQTTGLSANITPKALSVTGSTAANKVYDGGTAAVVSGGVLSGVISADLAAVSLSQSGNFADKNVANGIAVTAASTLSGAAAGNYSVGQTTGLSANITPKALSVTGSTAANKVYDGGTAAVVSGGVLSGVISADLAAVSLNQSGNFADKNVANGIAVTAASTLSGAAAGNYSVGQTTGLSANITPKALSVTGSTAANKVYDGGTAAVVSGGVLSGVISADLAAVSLNQSGNFADKNVANGIAVTAASTLSGAAAGNYSVGQTTGLSANITPKALSVTGSTAANKVYDGGTAAVVSGGVLSGVISADLAAVSLNQSGNFADKNVANGIAVTAASTLSGAAAGNYSVGQTTGLSANITPKALSVTGSTAANKVYDGGTAAVVSGGVLSGVISADLAAVSLSQSGNFADKNVANGIAVTAASTLSGAAAGNYSVGQTTGLSANITPKALSVTGSTAANKVYDGGTAAVVSGGVLSGVISADLAAVSLNQSGNFADKNVANGIAVTAASTLSGAAAGNYSVGQTTGLSANITPKALSVTGSTAANKVYDGGTAAVVSGGVLSGVISADLAAVSLNQSGNFADKNVANGIAVTAASTLSGAAAGNYSVGQTTGLSANITPKALSVTGSTAANKVYDGGTAAVVSGGVLSGVISADLAAVSLNQSGNFADKNVANGIAVTAASTLSGAAAGNYSVGQTTGLSANISKAALTISATAANKVYDGTTAATVAYGDSRFGNDNIIVSGIASYLDKNVGTAKSVNVSGISVAGADSGNYSLSTTSATTSADITKRALTIGGTGTDKVYDGTTSSGAVTLNDNRILGDALTVSSTGASFADKNAGIGKAVNLAGVSVTGADAGNYSFGTTGVATATITPRALSVSAGGLDKVYDGIAAASVVYVDNRLAGDNFTVVGSASFADKNVARGNVFGGTVVTTTDANGNSISKVVIGNTIGVVNKAISVSGINLAGLDANNYTSNTTAATAAKITPKTLTVSVSGIDKIYDGSAAATAALLDNRAVGDTLTTSYAAASFGDKNAGIAKTVNVSGISVSGADFANYSYSGSATAVTAASITPKALNVTATGTNKVYDGNTVGAVTLADNRVAGDALSVVNAAANFTDKNAGIGKTVNVTGISVTGSDVANYTFNTAAVATASITPKALGYSVTASGKEYDGNTSAVAAVSGLTGLVGSETVTVASNSATFNSKNVATANRVTVNSATLADGTGLASNYSIAGGGSAAASITARALTVTATGINKTYDGNASASVSYSDNRIGGDVLAVGGNASYLDKNAATGKTVNVNGITLSGQDATNYLLAVNTATTAADIARRALAVSATGVDKAYDGLTGATVLYTDNRVAGDALSVAGSASYLDKNAGTSRAVNVTGITLGSTDANNYTVNTSAATTASITPKALSYSTAASGKVYDGNTTATATVSGLAGFVGTETVGVAGNTATFNSKDVATANLVTVNSITLANGANGGLAGNYQIAAGGTAAAGISAKALSYTTAAVSKEYDGTASGTATLNGLTGLVGTETVTAIANATFNSKDVGVANQVTVNSIALSNGANGGLATNYSVAAGGTAAAGITAKALGYSTTAADKVYDGNTAATASLSLTGLVGTETVNVASTSASFNSKDVATANLVTVNSATLANGNNGGLASNYSIAGGGTAAANINAKLLTYDTAAANKVYDGSVSAVAGLSIVANGLVNNETVTATGTASFNSKDVATANLVTVNSAALVDGTNGGLASNYRINAGGTAAAAITRRGLDIAATGVNKVYDGTTVATAVLSDNRVAGDTLTGTYSSASYADKNVANGKVVNVSGIAIGGLDANNYTPTNTSAVTSASITPRALTVGATGINKVYDGTTVASAALSDNRVANDSLTASYSSAAYLDKNVANGKTVNVSGINVAGNDAINYSFNNTAVTSANITPRALSISASGVNKVYDGTTAAVVGYTDNRVAGDVLSIAGNASFVDKNAGSAKTVNVSGITLGNADAINYTFNGSAVTSASITPKALSVTANNDSRFFSGLAYSGGNGVVYSGLVAGETSAVLAGSLGYGGSSQGAVASGAYSINPAGLSSANYTIAYTNGVLNIGPASAGSAALGGPGLVPAYDSVLAGLPGSSGQGQGDGQSGSNGANGNNGANGLNGGSGSGAQPGGSLAQILGCGVSLPPGANATSCQ